MIFSCPHCGSRQFKIIGGNRILCEFCNQELSVEKIEFNNEDVALTQELTDGYYERIAALNQEKKKAHALLLYYKKLANPRKLITAFGILLAAAFVLGILFPYIYASNRILGIVYIVFVLLLAVGSLLGLIFAIVRNRKRRQKYQSDISFYASQVVRCENEIEIYSKQISKLIK